MKMGTTFDVMLSNGVEISILRTESGSWYLGLDEIECPPSRQIPEPYASEIRAASNYCRNAISKERADQMAANLDPPKIAEFLLTALATTAEAIVGDLNERFADECEKFGRPRAVRLYWARTLCSLWPLLRRAIAKALKWGAVIATVRRLF